MQTRWAALGVTVAAVLLMTSCGESPSMPPPFSIAVSPNSISVMASGTQQFSATLVGTASSNSPAFVTWSVNGVVGGNSTVGSISFTGLYTAPAAPPNPNGVTVTATSAADPSKSASATVTIKAAPVVLSISGTVFSGGALANSTVNVSNANPADGSVGGLLGTATTDSSGNFTAMLSSAPTGPVIITATGGTYTSTADGSVTTGTISLSAFFDSVSGPTTTGVAITPLTEFVATLTKKNLSGSGTAPTFANAHALGNATIAQFYGLGSGATTETIVPSFSKGDIAAHPANFSAGFVISSLETQGKGLVPATSDKLVAALSNDLDDGVFDGKGKVPIPLGNRTLNSTAGTIDFLIAGNDCAGSCSSIKNGGSNASDLTPVTAQVSSGVQASTLTPKAFGLTPGSSAALTTLAFEGHQYIFMAGRTKGIIVLDVTDPTNVAAKAWPCLATSTFSMNFVSGVVPVVGTESHPQVFVYAIAVQHITVLNAEVLATGTPPAAGLPCPASLVDVDKDIVITNPPVPFKAGNSTVFTGAIPDNGKKGVWLATSDGYEFFDLSTNSLTTTVYPVDVGQQLAENIGGDINHNQIVAGNYLGVQLIDLSLQKSFDMDSTFFTNNIVPLAPNDYVATTSVDTTDRVAIGTAEDVGNSFFINLATLSENTANSTFLPASTNGFAVVQMASPATGLDLTGASADASSHMVLFGTESNPGLSAWVAVGKLEDPAHPAGSTWVGMTDWVMWNILNSPSVAVGSDTYFPTSDPAVFGCMYNIGVGNPYGYLLASDDTFVVQVDMQGLFNMPRSGATGDAAHLPATDPGLTPGIFTVITGY